jgi:hypothetical protein
VLEQVDLVLQVCESLAGADDEGVALLDELDLEG